MSGYSPSTFSRVYSGCVGLASAQHTVDTLASLTSLARSEVTCTTNTQASLAPTGDTGI